ncbi:MAG: septal ring lytic transglycosylase RlpA family protein [Gammaproteobacteria bacterium]|nr:septal ring lytic transglycosylase RlpA family protein [Gammaproteobacteria bacterium]MBU1416055.1 septal ring lytic transglycosylase RlpA family protein [Gammaproteobacteria bacterium]
MMISRLAIALLALTLAACGTTSRKGGYYQDDGPGENPPADVANIPDAVPRAEAPHRYANRPYTVLGRDYVPLAADTPYRATGIASWYGRKFHGQKTAIGETYDMYGMTAAHPTLSIPSYARVTNLANGRSVVVRVNDRGPFLHSRIIDLSYAAAAKLGYIGRGSAEVRVESVGPGTAPAPDEDLRRIATADQPEGRRTPRSGGPEQREGWSEASHLSRTSLPEVDDGHGIYLQLGAFGNADNAANLRNQLARELDGDLRDRLVIRSGGGYYRVQLGPWASHDEARRVADRLDELIDAEPVVVRR